MLLLSDNKCYIDATVVQVLPIKTYWLKQIVLGEKKEEYRRITLYYDARFEKYEGKLIKIGLRAGYSYERPYLECMVIPHYNKTGKAKWGAVPNEKYWVLEIVELIKAVNVFKSEDN